MSARILVVDDIPANVKLLEVKLSAEYFEVLTASSGPEALEIAESQVPDLILTDVMMPEMDGFELCRRVKANPDIRHIPVVMVTALSEVSDRVRGLEAGADDFLTQPVNDVALFARVRSLARLKHMVDELRVRHAASGQEEVLFEAALGSPAETKDARVLLVEASEVNAEKITSCLAEQVKEVVCETTIAAALERSQHENFDLIIVNLHLEGDGLRLCSQLRSQELTRHVPILLTLDDEDLPSLAKGLDLGVTDYLIKPIDRNELRARCRTQVRRRYYHDKLRQTLRQSVSLAYIDSLTGVYNRRYLLAHLDRKIMEIANISKPVSAIVFDVDNFKAINDRLGHGAGDEVLVQMAKCVSAGIRDFDMVARLGGDEFVVVMPAADSSVAETVAERLRGLVAEETYRIDGQGDPIEVTISLGVATTIDAMETADLLLSRADQALYLAKRGGRNQVVSVGTEAAPEQRSAAAGS
jgi:two-component system cell cycle response regulator